MMSNITELPEDCLAYILSLTSPRDVLRSSAVSKHFLSVSESDTVWDKFIPSDSDSDSDDIISLIPRHQIVSKKDLFMHLCDFPILLDNKSFALDKRTGKICYTLGSRALSIIWGGSPEYWSWESIPESRFPECAVLKDVCWLEITGRIHTTLFSPGTAYGVYFVFKIKVDSFSTGLGRTPVKVSVSEISEDELPRIDGEIKRFFLKEPMFEEHRPQRRQRAQGELPIVRGDGWMEIEMGRCEVGVNGGDDGVMLKMSLKEVESLHWKSGLLVHGIEIRPLS